MNGKRSACSGFTLLELIIALTILGLMSAAMYSSLRLALNSYTISQNRLEREARKRVLQDQIQRQLGSVFPLRPTLAPDMVPGGASPLYAQFPLFYGTRDSVTFITVAPLMIIDNPGLSVVRYGLAEDEWGQTYLGAMESRFMGLDSFNRMAAIPRGKPLALVEDVRQVFFEYYGWDREAQQYRWFSSWNGEEMQGLPRAVRIDYESGTLVAPIHANSLDVARGLGGLVN